MQAGRWFGFREGYRDLVRLYIRREQRVDLYEAFEALLLDEEAFLITTASSRRCAAPRGASRQDARES
jgi:hypothetical protein